MTHRTTPGRPAEPLALPVFARLAPALPPDVLAAQIDAATVADDLVVDPFGRGGWVARTALAMGRRAVSVEVTPLTRLLADVVVRAPDLRHLDAAFQAVAAAPVGATSLRAAIDERFATRCPTCGRAVPLDEMAWAPDGEGVARPVRRSFRCPACLDRRGRGGELRHGDLEADDLERAQAGLGDPAVREELGRRFPLDAGPADLVDQLLDLHSPRQLEGLARILARIEGELRASQVTSALRLAFLHAVLPASRLLGHGGRVASLRIAEGRIRPPAAAWRERNPWRAFEDGYQLVRAFVQALDDGPYGAVQARLADPLDAVLDGPPMVSLRVGGDQAFERLAAEAEALPATRRAQVRLVLAQPAPAWTRTRLAEAFVLTSWTLGAEAGRLVAIGPLLGTAGSSPDAMAGLQLALRSTAPAMAADGTATVLLAADGPRGLLAAGIAGAAAGWRVRAARLTAPGRAPGGIVELVPPGGRLGSGPRTRANRPLAPAAGGVGDPGVVTAGGRFGGPVPIDGRFSVSELNRVITAAAVSSLQVRGEPAELRHLAGELLVALDRSGQLRRYALTLESAAGTPLAGPVPAGGAPTVTAAADAPPDEAGAGPGEPAGIRTGGPAAIAGLAAAAEDLLALVEGELTRPDQRKIASSAGGRLWLADPRDEAAAAAPLADRLEWAVFSLLGTGASIPEAAVRARLDEMFEGADTPDPWLVDACLASYGAPAPGDGRLVARDELQARSHEHAATIGLLADLGHRMGLHVAIAPREQARRADGAPLAARLLPDELAPGVGFLGRSGAEALEQVDACWYVRPRFAFLFEVEWTAMLGEPVLRRGRGIPADERIVRFLVVPPERVELLRGKLEGYPVLRAAMEAFNWHVLRTDALRRLAARSEVALDDLEPFLGLDPPADRPDQLPLFGG